MSLDYSVLTSSLSQALCLPVTLVCSLSLISVSLHSLSLPPDHLLQVQDMLSSVTYRMRKPSTSESTAENMMMYTLQDHPVGSDTGSSKNTEPGPEIGTSFHSSKLTWSALWSAICHDI
jgi:hypothetical protein